MKAPQFSVFKYGLFDSTEKFPQSTISRPRLVTVFEIEFYTSDHPLHTHINDREIPLLRGQLIIAKPGQIRYSHLPFRCLYFHLTDADEELTSLLRSLPDSIFFENPEEMQKKFRKLCAQTPKTAAEHLRFFGDIHDILFQVLLHTPTQENQSAKNIHSEQMRLLQIYIEENLSETLSLQTLASRVSLSPIYFHRIFCEYFGDTPARYVLGRRIAAAQMALLRNDITIAQIAADCGFSSQSYFSSKFRQMVGHSPLEYRQEMRSRPEI